MKNNTTVCRNTSRELKKCAYKQESGKSLAEESNKKANERNNLAGCNLR